MLIEGKSEEVVKGLANFADKLLGAPGARMKALRLAKEVDPNFRHVELENADAIDAAVKTRDERIDSLEKQMQADRIETARREMTERLKKQGYDIVAVEKVMTDNGISNYDSAIKFMKGEAAMAPPTPPSQRSATQLPPNMAEIAKNPTKWARDEAEKAVNELMAAKVNAG